MVVYYGKSVADAGEVDVCFEGVVDLDTLLVRLCEVPGSGNGRLSMSRRGRSALSLSCSIERLCSRVGRHFPNSDPPPLLPPVPPRIQLEKDGLHPGLGILIQALAAEGLAPRATSRKYPT
jgi:hypothetical protein